VQQLAPLVSRAPDNDVVKLVDDSIVEATKHGRRDVGGRKIEPIAWSIQVARHNGVPHVTMLTSVGIAQSHTSELRETVRLGLRIQRA
jgi:hypothetical protein